MHELFTGSKSSTSDDPELFKPVNSARGNIQHIHVSMVLTRALWKSHVSANNNSIMAGNCSTFLSTHVGNIRHSAVYPPATREILWSTHEAFQCRVIFVYRHACLNTGDRPRFWNY